MAFRIALLPAALASLHATTAIYADDWPAPIQALVEQGLEIHGEFAAPSGLTGYAASHQGREMTVYLTADGNHAIAGSLLDAEGNDVGEAALYERIRQPQEKMVWRQLEASHWIADGRDDAPRVLYTFTDPNCPYCRRFWEATRPWVEAGEVQLRHVLVGILQQDSPAKAASLLGAEDPAAALREHSNGEDVAPTAQPRDIEDQVYRNNQLFEELGFYATPTTVYYLDERLDRVAGMPDEERLREMMGSETP